VEKLGSRTPTFYSSIQPGAGYPRVSIFLARLIKELDNIVSRAENETGQHCHMNNVSTAAYLYILRIL
jgi:hypothetical protein